MLNGLVPMIGWMPRLIGEGLAISDITSIVSAFFTQIGAVATTVLTASVVFLIPIGIKFTGKAIGFAKSLMGTGGRRRR